MYSSDLLDKRKRGSMNWRSILTYIFGVCTNIFINVTTGYDMIIHLGHLQSTIFLLALGLVSTEKKTRENLCDYLSSLSLHPRIEISLLSLDMAVVSQAPSPDSNPDSPSHLTSMTGAEPTMTY